MMEVLFFFILLASFLLEAVRLVRSQASVARLVLDLAILLIVANSLVVNWSEPLWIGTWYVVVLGFGYATYALLARQRGAPGWVWLRRKP